MREIRSRITLIVITYVVQELCARIPLNIMRIKVTPSKLYIDPVLVACSAIQNVFVLYQEMSVRLRFRDNKTHVCHERWAGNVPLVRREQQDVGA